MSDPQPDRLKNKPARAEPWQPDAPGRGDTRDPGAPPGSTDAEKAKDDRPQQRTADQPDTAPTGKAMPDMPGGPDRART